MPWRQATGMPVVVQLLPIALSRLGKATPAVRLAVSWFARDFPPDLSKAAQLSPQERPRPV